MWRSLADRPAGLQPLAWLCMAVLSREMLDTPVPRHGLRSPCALPVWRQVRDGDELQLLEGRRPLVRLGTCPGAANWLAASSAAWYGSSPSAALRSATPPEPGPTCAPGLRKATVPAMHVEYLSRPSRTRLWKSLPSSPTVTSTGHVMLVIQHQRHAIDREHSNDGARLRAKC